MIISYPLFEIKDIWCVLSVTFSDPTYLYLSEKLVIVKHTIVKNANMFDFCLDVCISYYFKVIRVKIQHTSIKDLL